MSAHTPATTPAPTIRSANTRDVPAATLHDVMRLRQDVFVIEQQCLYPDLDGRDVEPDSVQVWAEDEGGTVLATLRVLADQGGVVRIGRVATAVPARDRGVAARMMVRALETTTGPVVLDAQSHLAYWYERFGFVTIGDEFLDDGIPHVHMRLER